MLNRFFLVAVFFVLAFFVSNRLFGQTLKARVDSVINSYVNRGIIPGAVVQIKLAEKVLVSESYGHAQIHTGRWQKLKVPHKMTTNHLFDIASLTKVVGTTTAMMILVDRGKIRLDDKVVQYIPSFSDGSKSDITIRHLLQHTSGMYEWYPMYYRASGREQVYELIHSLPVPNPVGIRRRYSDLGFTLLGEIIEKVSGMPLENFLKQEVFDRLKMHHTFYNPHSEHHKLRIAATSFGNPYEKRMVYDPALGFQFAEINPDSWNAWRDYVLVGEVNDGNAWYGGKGVSGAAGLFSTVSDLQKLTDMLLSGGKIGETTFISSDVVSTFLTKDEFENGLGWVMDPKASFMKNVPPGSFGHTGFTGTSIVVIPERQLSVIILINRQHTGLTDGKNYFNVNLIRQAILDSSLEVVKSSPVKNSGSR